ncbi:MAG TPA: sulfotransferase [Rhizomicrobium sp.]|nr:sulfotransferase [Rhizomicrobium sp.]
MTKKNPQRSITVQNTGPVIVFGTGGSGTRAVAAFLSACGIEMGSQVNPSWDARLFGPLLRDYIGKVIAATRCLDYDPWQIDPLVRTAVVDGYLHAAEAHRRGMGTPRRWGFKEPRNIFLLPLVNMAFPDAKFVHVLRDGRDMLLSRNRNQPSKHFESLFGRPFDHTDGAIAQFWAKSNLEAYHYGTQFLGRRYVIIRIEDACEEGRKDILLQFATMLDIDYDVAERCSEVFHAQETFGRGSDYSGRQRLPAEFEAALGTFHYG